MSIYGLIIGISLVIGTTYFQRHNLIIPKKNVTLFLLGLIIFGIIGARAYHVADQWVYYSQNLSQIPATWNGGLAIYGAIIGGFIFLLLFSFFARLSLFKLLESIIPVLPLCQSIGRLGNFFNHENPIWWQEAVLDLILFLVLRSKVLTYYSSTALYLIGYGLIRFFTEFYRNDTWVIGYIKIAHFISIIFILAGVILLIKLKNVKISARTKCFK